MKAAAEDEFVAAIAALTRDGSSGLIVGIGDDAAAWQPSRSNRSIITTDASVDGVHFSAATMSRYDAGWRSMAANLSDVAAMGARPVLATVALGIPETAGPDEVLEYYRGIAACAKSGRCAIAGGDLTRAPALMSSITVVGEVRASNLKRRAGGRAGDVLAVTGPLGGSRAGLALALDPSLSVSDGERDAALRAHRLPLPRLDEGRFLGASVNVHAMMDCSDGLSTDVARLSAASGVAAVLERVPVAPAADAVARALNADAQRFALAGGEDYELLVSIAPRAFGYLSQRFRARFGRTLEAVGHLREGAGCFWRNDEREELLPPSGWDHFAR